MPHAQPPTPQYQKGKMVRVYNHQPRKLQAQQSLFTNSFLVTLASILHSSIIIDVDGKLSTNLIYEEYLYANE